MISNLARTKAIFSVAIILRITLLFWGTYQDRISSVKYTDIDYYVFTDAARFVAQGKSPYDRETYRYTPLLSWLLLPTVFWFPFGKILFALGDVVAGWLIMNILQSSHGMSRDRALTYTCIWLLNPIVAQISTRGSSEGLLGVFVIALLWAALSQKSVVTGILLGFAVHFKIYPFIYGLSILCDIRGPSCEKSSKLSITEKLRLFIVNRKRIVVVCSSLVTFMGLNVLMWKIYGDQFVLQSYSHHFTRLDHRHNFSVYNIGLYLDAVRSKISLARPESLAFLPQLLVSAVAIPIALANRDLASAMFAQTFAFVMFNKVCTSQYFLWYMVLLPLYLPSSSFLANPTKGLTAISLWVIGQALWLQQGYNLEFVGKPVFVSEMWLASLAFFAINACLLGIIISDITDAKSVTRLNISAKRR